MNSDSRIALRIFLVVIYFGLFLLLFPWLPVAIWSGAFLSNPVLEYSAMYLLIGKVLPFLVIVYPIFMVHGSVSSWLAIKRGKSSSIVLLKALYPLLLIIPVLLVVVAFVKQ